MYCKNCGSELVDGTCLGANSQNLCVVQSSLEYCEHCGGTNETCECIAVIKPVDPPKPVLKPAKPAKIAKPKNTLTPGSAKITLLRKDLNFALSVLTTLNYKSSTNAINAIELTFYDEALKLRSTCLSVEARATLNGVGLGQGAICIDYKLLQKAVKQCSSDSEITLSLDDACLTVSGGSVEQKIWRLMDASDMPLEHRIDEEKQILSLGLFHDVATWTAKAIWVKACKEGFGTCSRSCIMRSKVASALRSSQVQATDKRSILELLSQENTSR